MYKSILVPLDGSELSECTLQHVKAIAQGCHVTDVTLLTVVLEPQLSSIEWGNESQVKAMVQETENVQKLVMDSAEKYLAEATKKLSEENIGAKTTIVQAKWPQGVADVILDYSKNNSTDLIIMSTHGRSGITRWAMGSVADKVIRSQCHSGVTCCSIWLQRLNKINILAY